MNTGESRAKAAQANFLFRNRTQTCRSRPRPVEPRNWDLAHRIGPVEVDLHNQIFKTGLLEPDQWNQTSWSGCTALVAPVLLHLSGCTDLNVLVPLHWSDHTRTVQLRLDPQNQTSGTSSRTRLVEPESRTLTLATRDRTHT